MKITKQATPTDPQHPIMHGDTPFAQEFNARQDKLWKEGKNVEFGFEQVVTVLLEILVDEYDARNKKPTKKPKAKPNEETTK